MASVQVAQLRGPSGFSRPVAVKRLHPHLARDPSFAALFLEEARLSARIAHANVVATLDVIEQPDEIAVVMEYIHGESLAGLLRLARERATPVPHAVATNLLVGVLHGLHAAHETRSEQGEPLGIVHRDVSPENILVGSDGIARISDFGIAKATGRTRITPSGELKGKLGYMAPEQYDGREIDRRVDVYGASVVLWEALAGRPLFTGASDAQLVHAVLSASIAPPSVLAPDVPPALDRLVLQGLSRDPEQRFGSARQMALALEHEIGLATQSQVTDWLHDLAGELLQERSRTLAQLRAHAESDAAPAHGTRRVVRAARAPSAGSAEHHAPTSAHMAQSGTRLTRAKHVFALAVVIALPGAWLASGLQEAPPAAPSPAPTAQQLGAVPTPRDVPPSALTVEPPIPAVAAHAEPVGPGTRPVPAPQRPASARPERRVKPTKAQQDAPMPEAPQERVAEPRGIEAGGSAREPSGDCSEPYEVDPLGIRRWKPECL
jgi:serine/threonine-protein kinase